MREWSGEARIILVGGTDDFGAKDVDWPDFELVALCDRREQWPGEEALEIARDIWQKHGDEIEARFPELIAWGRLVFVDGANPYDALGGRKQNAGGVSQPQQKRQTKNEC
jgi:hypothetical protein